MRRYDVLIQECDHDIRTGSPRKAAKRLSGLNIARVPSEWRLPLAKICRRAGQYSIGLKLLNHLVERLPSEPGPPPDADLAEYSALLVRIGATSEALERLAEVNTSVAPEALLYRAYAHFDFWQYEAAIESLEKYLSMPLSEYARLVGNTNLGYAYAGNRNQDLAIEVLTETIRTTSERGLRQLQSTCHALRAQVHIQLEDFGKACEDIKCARNLSDEAHTNDNFLTVLWELILEGLESRSQTPFDRLRELAQTHQNWEASRQADFYSLRVKPNQEKFLHLYFGTPFEKFRDIIHRELGPRPNRTIYVLGNKAYPRLDLQTGQIDGKDAVVFGGKVHQLLQALLSDFYQPSRVAGLFASLFPGEHFNISSSPGRVHQILWRARDWLKAENIPIEIAERNGFYSLRITGKFSFRVPIERAHLSPVALRFEKIKTHFGPNKPFPAREAQALLGVSKTTLHELLKWGVENGQIEKMGDSARSTTYSIVSRPNKKAA